ncbi:MAG: monovalent cation/H+ antiporter subunit D family protein [Nitrospirae bacterium]|nr:monovalent cation/H+ antiporter subunit D family protein [Nitrospirota bacterium]
MNIDNWMPVFVILSSLVPAIIIFLLNERQNILRTIINMSAAFIKIALVGMMTWGVFHERNYIMHFPVVPGIEIIFRADALAMFFLILSAGLWLLTTAYAVGYLEGSPNRRRFFGFFSLCVTSTMGISLAGNLFTFFIFYEMLTLTTYPLVVHRGTQKSLEAGSTYLRYTLSGGAVLLIGIVWLHVQTGTLEFTQGGYLNHAAGGHAVTLTIIFALLIIGLAVKTAIIPLHGWLPAAMVAPAPVSALLHAVAVVKAGAFGIVRVVNNVYGVEFAATLGVTMPLAFVASATIIYGSFKALFQDDLKKRLAYSTISQVSYIVLGVAIAGPLSTIGGITHIVHQGIMKITLFFCAGVLAETLGIHRISEMRGVGRRLPMTMAAFTIAALGMIGVPPTVGFITKWYLGIGAIDAGQTWVLAVLGMSTLLNAAYFLPIINSAWFIKQSGDWPEEKKRGRFFETDPWLLFPVLIIACFTILAGILAGEFFSPLEWAKLITEREYR